MYAVLLAATAASASAGRPARFAYDVKTSKDGALRVIDFGNGTRVSMTEDQVAALVLPGKKGGFVDVTDFVEPTYKNNAAKPPPTQIKHDEWVKACFDDIDKDAVVANIQAMGKYNNRYYTTQDAKDAAEELLNNYRRIGGQRTDITYELFEHTWAQPSFIVQMKGDGSTSETVILGGHLDSTAGSASAKAPGEDDDASGSSAVFEAFRVLVKNGFKPKYNVEFHGYAAEEGGLRGSAAVAAQYNADGRDVYGMMQLDMIGYKSSSGVMGIITDRTDAALNDFTRMIADEYSEIGWQNSQCGYGCSDHASWTTNGYPAVFPFETPFGQHNPSIHTARDTLAVMDMDYAMNFVKLGLGFVVEMACDPETEGCSA